MIINVFLVVFDASSMDKMIWREIWKLWDGVWHDWMPGTQSIVPFSASARLSMHMTA